MANFDEDIKRITDEILSDGTVDQIIREKVTDGIEKAIASSFNYGKLEKAVKERVEQVLVPFIENYDMSAYIVKLDTVLTEIVNKSVLMDNKQMLENFQYLMKEPQITVGILSGKEIEFFLPESFVTPDGTMASGIQKAVFQKGKIYWQGKAYNELSFSPIQDTDTFFELKDVTIGINFHWERKEDQCFLGALKIIVENGKLTGINVIHVED